MPFFIDYTDMGIFEHRIQIKTKAPRPIDNTLNVFFRANLFAQFAERLMFIDYSQYYRKSAG